MKIGERLLSSSSSAAVAVLRLAELAARKESFNVCAERPEAAWPARRRMT